MQYNGVVAGTLATPHLRIWEHRLDIPRVGAVHIHGGAGGSNRAKGREQRGGGHDTRADVKGTDVKQRGEGQRGEVTCKAKEEKIK